MSSTCIDIRRQYVKLCESDRICKRKRLKKSRVGVILPVREDVGSKLWMAIRCSPNVSIFCNQHRTRWLGSFVVNMIYVSDAENSSNPPTGSTGMPCFEFLNDTANAPLDVRLSSPSFANYTMDIFKHSGYAHVFQ